MKNEVLWRRIQNQFLQRTDKLLSSCGSEFAPEQMECAENMIITAISIEKLIAEEKSPE